MVYLFVCFMTTTRTKINTKTFRLIYTTTNKTKNNIKSNNFVNTKLMLKQIKQHNKNKFNKNKHTYKYKPKYRNETM